MAGTFALPSEAEAEPQVQGWWIQVWHRTGPREAKEPLGTGRALLQARPLRSGGLGPREPWYPVALAQQRGGAGQGEAGRRLYCTR